MFGLIKKKLAIVSVVAIIGIAFAVAFGVAREPEIQQRVVSSGNENSWLDPLFLNSIQEKVKPGAYYKHKLAVGEEGFFNGEASGGKPPYQFEWIFSDGFTSNSQNSTRSFVSSGQYEVQLIVTDTASKSDKISFPIQVFSEETLSAPGNATSSE